MRIPAKALAFLRRLEYAAAAFYCRQWLRSTAELGSESEVARFFWTLFSDEFRHWRYASRTFGLPADLSLDAETRLRLFVDEQQAILDAPQPSKSRLTPLRGVTADPDMIGIGSRFLVFRLMFGDLFTRELDWPNMIAMIRVVDESNHLLYQLLDRLDGSRSYAPMRSHSPAHGQYCRSSRGLLAKWSLKYAAALLVGLPVDAVRIARQQLQ